MKKVMCLIVMLAIPVDLAGQQWNTFRFDNGRSGVTSEDFEPARLELAWQWKSPLPPSSAWDGPARWDAFSRIRDLPAMRQYDACFHPVSDGETVFFGSSSQDTLMALDLADGKRRWSFMAGGPIRLAPTIDGDRVLFGCDDGNAYCVDRVTGLLVWKFNPSKQAGADQRRLINNDRLISYFPVRTGITVRDGLAYFGASFLPWRESFICAVNAETGGMDDKKNTYSVRHEAATLEGNLLVAEDRLIVPQGRIAPHLFDRTDGKSLGSLPGGGGVTVVLTETGEVVRTEGGSAARAGQVGVFKGKERVASFPRGRSIVVSGEDFFVIDGQKLFAASRMTNELKWSREVDEPLELILAGKTLFVGGRDHVTAVNADNGHVVWSAKTDGRVFGLMVAGRRLIVSTDSGAIHVYAQTGQSGVKADVTREQNWESPRVARVREKNLLHRWVFHRTAMQNTERNGQVTHTLDHVVVKDQSSNADLKLQGNAEIVQINKSDRLEAVQLRGGMFPVEENIAAGLPTDSITIESWVRVDQPQEWGGIAGCIQDDGSVEHGWLLGYRGDCFCLAIAGTESGLTYLSATEAFKPNSWNQVVGTYNGREMRLYVNGSLAANSTSETGPISYADRRYFTIGAYRDSNESYPLDGALQEVRIYSTALSATDVARAFRESAADFEIRDDANGSVSDFVSWGPYARFLRPGQVELTYGTVGNRATVVDLISESEVRRLADDLPVTEHKIMLEGLPHRRILQYQIRDGVDEHSRASEGYSLDTHFDWSPAIVAEPSESTKKLVLASPNLRGLVFVIGADGVERARQLAIESQFNVVLVVEKESTAAEIRQSWLADKEIVYGNGLSVCVTPINQLPAASASIVISQQDDDRCRRLVRPDGGILHDGVAVIWKRSEIEGSGVWSHMYGQADNSAFGGEALSNASDREDLVTQWIGRPGPRYQTDRQNRKPSPLAVGGRLFLQGQQRMIALDSYSGTVLWSVEAPTVMRWNVPHDCSNWCADENGVFVAAENQAWFVDGKDGRITRRFEIPVTGKSAQGKSWGFISCYKNRLFGTVVDSSAIYTQWWGKSQWFDSTGGDDTHIVAGDQLFSMDAETGELQWRYDGLVLHPTITVMDDRIYFVENTTEALPDSDNPRISLNADQACKLVCLDVATGEKKWQHSLSMFAGHIASLYLAGGGEQENRCLVTVASEATKNHFAVAAFDPQTGKPKWERTVDWEANHHGKHISRPAMQGELMYLRPEVLSLADGTTIHRGFPGGHGCASYALSKNGMFARLGETTWWDVRTRKVNRFDRIRTDCWISVVPAQGMLLSAEGGGGCSCGTWLETSLGFLPRSVDEEFPQK